MNVYLMRHGETDWNREGRMQGRRDTALNAAGIAQVQASSRMLQEQGVAISRIVSSPLRRAAETAAIMAEARGLPVEFDERLAERAFGELEGRTKAEINAMFGLAEPEAVLASAYGIESAATMLGRVRSALAELAAREDDVLVVTHGSVIRALTDGSGVIGNGIVMRYELSKGGRKHMPATDEA